MKSNKERILNFLRLQAVSNQSGGISTQSIAAALKIGRTNVSSLLNELVSAGLVEKTNGRPVLYYPAGNAGYPGHDCFSNMVGADGSLQHAIQLAKAALIYPGKSLNALLIGDQGVGKSFLAMLMHRFAAQEGILPSDAPFVLLDCRSYQENELGLAAELSPGNECGAYASARGGILHIDNAQFLSPGNRSRIAELSAYAESAAAQDRALPILIVACDQSNKTACEYYEKTLPITIPIPTLAERPLSERMTLIQSFLTLEAARAKRIIVLNAELLRCLLLYDCSANNILQLKADIKRGCATAYLREHSNGQGRLYLYITDFDPSVRKGFLHYRERRAEVELLIPDDYRYEFSESTMEMSSVDRAKLLGSSLYDEIDRRTSDLMARGLAESDVKSMLCIEYEAMFRQYWNATISQAVNKEQLLNLVGAQVIALVENFLSDAGARMDRIFPPSVFYGLCLHVSALSKKDSSRQMLSNQQIAEIAGRHRTEYALSLEFTQQLEKAFGHRLPLEEAMLITLFLCTETEPAANAAKPVMLFALHGAGVATSLSACINAVVGGGNTFALDIPFEQDTEQTYAALKDCIGRIHCGDGGIVALYDMDFLERLLDTAALETGVQIRTIAFPVTLFGIECARKAALAQDADALYPFVMQSLDFYRKPLPRAIITLCTTGAGGAQELKSYIERYGGSGGTEVVALACADRERLKTELAALQKRVFPVCIVGTHDPRLFGIPFIPVGDVLGCDRSVLPEVLRGKNREKQRIDADQVFDYLDEQFEFADTKKLRRLLPAIVERFNTSITPMSIDTEVGLLMHIACSVNRLCSGAATPQNLRKEEIIDAYGAAYAALRRELRPLEKAFHIIFPDDELANILMIQYKL
ncbi:MAG TPA: PRD domain-containing protein [Eubacteriales bacterium]|nr:PRD domain-containing protein [Eubacteriales bacterium]